MFNRRSKTLLLSNVLSSSYLIYLLYNFLEVISVTKLDDFTTTIVLIYILTIGISTLCGWIGFSFRASWVVLIGIIIYFAIPTILQIYVISNKSIINTITFGFGTGIFIVSVVPLLILETVGYITQRSINKKLKQKIR